MKKSIKRAISLSALTAVAAAVVVVVPPGSAFATEASSQYTVNTVIFEVNDEKIAVEISDYGRAHIGQNSDLMNFLIGDNEVPKVVGVNFGGKLVAIEEYGTQYLANGDDSQAIFENVKITTIANLKKVKFNEGGIAVLEPVEQEADEENPVEFDVETVKAITNTIELAASQQLKIQVNGDKEVTVKELTDEGYTVKFLYNQATSPNYNTTTGVVNGLSAAKTFKYAVEVTPAEGEKITSAWTDVTVVDVTAIAKVTAVQLSNKLAYINVLETGVTVNATEAVNVGGKTVTEDLLPQVKSITSSDETVLYANADKTLTARKAGNVTLTIEFVDIKDKVTLNVEVKAQQAATSISDATVKTALTTKAAQFKVLDADGKELRAGSKGTALTADVKDSEGVAVQTVSGTQSNFSTGVAISVITKAGTYSVEVLDGTTKIGTYSLQVVDTANAIADEYKILTADNKTTAELDINVGEDAANTLDVTVSNYSKGVALGSILDLTDATKFEVVTATKDSKVVTVVPNANGTITLTAGGTVTGTETITLKTVSGDYKETVATFTVTVKNTTAQVTSLVVKDSKDPIVLNESLLKDTVANEEAIKTAIASKVQSNLETFEAGLIEKFEVTSQGSVIVTIKAKNGGKEFTLPFTIDLAPTITSATINDKAVTITGGVDGTINLSLEGNITTGTIATSVDATLTIKSVGSADLTVLLADKSLSQLVGPTATTLNVIELLASLDEGEDGISLDTLDGLATNGELVITGTLTDAAGNVSVVSLTVVTSAQ